MRKKLFAAYFMLTFFIVSITSFFFINRIMGRNSEDVIIYICLSVLVGTIISSIIGVLFLNLITAPLYDITNIAKKIADGDFKARINEKYDDEYAMLAGSINNMTDKLNETINELYDRNAKLEAVLTTIINGVIAVDMDQKVLLVNKAASDMLNIDADAVVGKHILAVIRNSSFYDVFEGLLKENELTNREIEFFDPEYKCVNLYLNPIMSLKGQMGYLIVLNDVTEVKRLEKMRTDFAANVSHEIRTPLTSIKGFVETLRDGAVDNDEMRYKFLGIIDLETDRLTRLLNDILLLSEIEGLKDDVPKEDVDVNEIAEDVLYMLKSKAQDKKVHVYFKSYPEKINMMSNKDRIKQMLINLIENAIKYNVDNGSVYVTIKKDQDNVTFEIKDTGIGIREEHLPRLFERFYRVDKGRSRKMGGTGLGLAIVKHIVNSLKGDIDVKSKVGEGTTFTIKLPENLT